MKKNMKTIEYFFNIIVLLGIILAIFIIIVLVNSFFQFSHPEIWAKTYAPLIAALGILIASALASISVMRTMAHTESIEDNRNAHTLHVKELYFYNTMEGIFKSLGDDARLFQTHLDYHIDNGHEHIDLKGNIIFILQEMNDILRDYIDIINDESLPSTLKEIKNDFSQAMQDLTELKKEMYNLKVNVRSLSYEKKVDFPYFEFIIRKLNKISSDAEKLNQGYI